MCYVSGLVLTYIIKLLLLLLFKIFNLYSASLQVAAQLRNGAANALKQLHDVDCRTDKFSVCF